MFRRGREGRLEKCRSPASPAVRARRKRPHGRRLPKTPRNSRRRMSAPWLRRRHRIGSSECFDRGRKLHCNMKCWPMAEMGQSLPTHLVPQGLPMSAVTPRPDMPSHRSEMTQRAISDNSHRSNERLYSITSSARASSDGGTSRPSALAVLRLITSSYLVGACTGRSAGFSPLRMRST